MAKKRHIDDFKALIASLDLSQSTDEKVKALQRIEGSWDKLRRNDGGTISIIKDSNLFIVLSDVLQAKENDYTTNFPKWVSNIIWNVAFYDDVGHKQIFPQDQFSRLLEILHSYLKRKCLAVCICIRDLAYLVQTKLALIQHEEILGTLKQMVEENSEILEMFRNFTDGYESAQLAILSDPPFVLRLLDFAENDEDLWGIIGNLAQHPDAKTLLPAEVLPTVRKVLDNLCKDICIMLCSDDISDLELNEEWISVKVKLLNELLSTGKAVYDETTYNLLDLILPLANLSVVESQKEIVGKRMISLLMRVVSDELPDSKFITPLLSRGRQEAARAVWNFAYVESNCALISRDSGVEKLNKTLTASDDPVLKKNIEGILYMLNRPAVTPSDVSAKGHIMISYNWGNQPIIKRISKSLQDRGYHVWLDIERMAGSTLGAMASAVEGADLVLMCMSQKYKDSPNCRLEGEYTVNRRVDFLPLMMQQGYKPDGWLGIALGAKLWYDFTDESNWDVKIEELVKVIGSHGRGKGSIESNKTVNNNSHIQSTRKPLVSWTMEDVHEWMKLENIDHHFETFRKHKMNGIALSELKRLYSYNHPPSFLLQYFQQQLGIIEFGETLCLSSAINKL